MNIKAPLNLQGHISPLQKYQLLLVDQLFSQLLETTGTFHLKLWLLKKMVNVKEPFSALIKHLFSAVDVALESKPVTHLSGNICSGVQLLCIVYSGVVFKPLGCEEARRPPRCENPSTSTANILVASAQCQ